MLMLGDFQPIQCVRGLVNPSLCATEKRSLADNPNGRFLPP
jgi:hypothetical protein